MGIRNSTVSSNVLIEKYLGTAYDTVKEVADNLTSVSGVNSISSDVSAVAAIASDVTQVVDSVDQFNNVYYGSLATVPSTRPDSTPIQDGDMYYNSTSNQLYIYQGASFIPMGSIQNSLERQVATEGQTVFTLSTISYIPGSYNLIVMVNGVFQYSVGDTHPDGSYVENNSSTITFDEGLTAGDVVTFLVGTAVSTTNPNISVTKKYYTVQASDVSSGGVTVLTIPDSQTYVPQTNNLQIRVNGLAQYADAYDETSTTTVTFDEGLQEGDVIEYTIGNIIGNIPTLDIKVTTIATASNWYGFTTDNDDIVVYMKGYHTVGDGGEGEFTYDASALKSTANGGTIIDTTVPLVSQGTGTGTGCWIRQYSGAVNVKWFGAKGDGTTDDTSAVQSAISQSVLDNAQIYYPKGTYLVTNFHKKVGAYHYGDYASWKVGTVTTPIPLYGDKTWSDYTIYVETTGDNDSNCGLSTGTAYKSIQYALDSLPSIINHEVTIKLGDGTYNTTNRSAGSMSRPSIAYIDRNIIRSRTYLDGEVKGGITIKGNTTTPANVIIENKTGYTYGVYVQQGQVAIESLKIKANLADTQALLVAHRQDTYLHCNDVLIDGNSQTTYGMYGESGANIEFTGSGNIIGCTVGVASFANSYVSISGNTTITSNTTGLSASNSSLDLQLTVAGASVDMVNTNTTGISCQNSKLYLRGYSSANKFQTTDPIKLRSSKADLVYSEIDSTISLKGAEIVFDNSSFQNQITAYSSNIHLRDSNSFITGHTENDSTHPMKLYSSNYSIEGTCSIAGASGTFLNTTNLISKTINNSSTLTLSVEEASIVRTSALYLAGNGADVTNCQIDTKFFAEGDLLRLVTQGSQYNVGLVDGTFMEIPTGFTLGRLTGNYTGATFVLLTIGGVSKWRLVGLGQVRP